MVSVAVMVGVAVGRSGPMTVAVGSSAGSVGGGGRVIVGKGMGLGVGAGARPVGRATMIRLTTMLPAMSKLITHRILSLQLLFRRFRLVTSKNLRVKSQRLYHSLADDAAFRWSDGICISA